MFGHSSPASLSTARPHSFDQLNQGESALMIELLREFPREIAVVPSSDT